MATSISFFAISNIDTLTYMNICSNIRKAKLIESIYLSPTSLILTGQLGEAFRHQRKLRDQVRVMERISQLAGGRVSHLDRSWRCCAP